MLLLLALLSILPPSTGCDPTPHLVSVAPYVFEWDPTGCEGDVAVAVFRHAPDFEYVEPVVEEGRLTFADDPGSYQVAVCYPTAFAETWVKLP